MSLVRPGLEGDRVESQALRDGLRTKLGMILGRAAAELDSEQRLVDVGLDSYGFVELISHVEATYDLRLTEAELISEELASLAGIAALVERRLNAST